MASNLRIGHGYDVHRLVEGRRCIIGGVDIPHSKGLLGHSDADVLAHALSDAILGACRGGDIGKLFPDTDPAYEGADSLTLLSKVMEYARQLGYELVDADCTIACQEPKIGPHREAMRENLARAIGCSVENIGVKATTTEKLGWEGKGEGIGVSKMIALGRFAILLCILSGPIPGGAELPASARSPARIDCHVYGSKVARGRFIRREFRTQSRVQRTLRLAQDCPSAG